MGQLADSCSYVNDRVSVKELTLENYISTENMLPNKSGITTSAGLPLSGSVIAYKIGDVLTSNIRPYFKKIWYADRNGGCSNDVLVLRTKQGYDSRFLYYILSDDRFFNYSTNSSKGTKMPRGDKSAIMQYSVPIVDFPTQRAIAATLSCLDDKIELNNKINANLEAQAQAIFINTTTDTAMWKTGNLSQLIDFKNGKSRPTSVGTIPVYGGNGILSYTDISNTANAVIIGRVGAYCGSLFLETSACWVSDNAIFAKSKLCEEEYYDYFLLQSLGLSGRHIGTSQPLLTQGILNTIEIPIPSIEIINQYNDTVSPFFAKIRLNTEESVRLAAIRDALLPKLMSGEIEVPVEV